MPTRAEHLQDIFDRLSGKVAPVGGNIFRSRVAALPVNKLPAICLYAPEEDSGPAEVVTAQPQYQPSYTLAIEIRVPERDGFDVLAGEIAEAVKTLLLTDQDWINRFRRYPRWKVRQFLERRGEESFCGEVITLTVTDRRPTEYRPKAPMLTGITQQAVVAGIAVTAALESPPDPEV